MPSPATFGTAQEEENGTCHRSWPSKYKRGTHREQYFASKPCTWQGRSVEWGGANPHRSESTTLASAANTKVSQLVNRLSCAGCCFILLLPSEFICMQTFGFLDHLRLTHCNMLIGCFPRRSSRQGLGSVESRSCSASSRMIISATFMPGVAACPGHPCSVLSYFLALPAPHIYLSSIPLSCPREELEASRAMPEGVFGCLAAHRHT